MNCRLITVRETGNSRVLVKDHGEREIHGSKDPPLRLSALQDIQFVPVAVDHAAGRDIDNLGELRAVASDERGKVDLSLRSG